MPPKEKHPQVAQRRWQVFFDQHNRKWGAPIDIRNGSPAAPLQPLFKAPWVPPQHILKTGKDPERVQDLVIDYPTLLAERDAALEEWTKHMMKIGDAMHGEQFDPQKPSPSVLRRAGTKPESPQIVLAAIAADPWILGFTEEMPEWATPYFLKKEEDRLAFLKRGKPTGKGKTAEPAGAHA
jgi:hypothetical protein